MKEYPIVENHDDLTQVVDLILNEAGLDRSDQGGSLSFTGKDPIRPTHIKVGSAAAAVLRRIQLQPQFCGRSGLA